MMQKQSFDFIVGFVFARMDTSIFDHFWTKERKDVLVESFSVPKIWFGLSSSSNPTNDIIGSMKYEMVQKLNNNFNDLYPRLETVCERIVPEKQYIRFDFKVKYREVVKKMTVSEIEEALGYKIEIVGDK